MSDRKEREKMKNVKLTEKQESCVNFSEDRDLIIRGIAGSGKSLVLANRAVHLVRKGREMGKNPSVAFLTFAKTLVGFTNEFVRSCGEAFQAAITISNIDSVIFQLHKAMFGFKRFTYDDKILLAELSNTIESLVGDKDEIASDFRFVDLSRREFLLEELQWMKEHSFNEEEQYVACVRKGRGTVVVRRAERPAIFKIYQNFYKRLETKGILTVELAANKIVANKEKIPELLRFDFVMIDEAQDLSLIKLLVAKALARHSMTIAADFAQKIYSTGFTWKELGLEIRGNASQKLGETYRNTLQIAKLAAGLSSRNTEEKDEDYITPPKEFPKREGPKPFLFYMRSHLMQRVAIIDLIREIRSKAPEDTVAVLGRTGKQLYEVKKWLTEGGIDFDVVDREQKGLVTTPGVKVVTYHSSKGLEFDRVILPMVDDGVFPNRNVTEEDLEDELNKARNLLFVGMTRARTWLYMYTTDGTDGEPSPLFDEMDKDLMDIEIA